MERRIRPSRLACSGLVAQSGLAAPPPACLIDFGVRHLSDIQMRAHVTQGQQAFPQLIRTRKNGGEKLPGAAKLAVRAARRASGVPGGEGSPLGQRPWALALLQWVCNSGRLSPTRAGPCPRGVRGLIFQGQPRTRGLLLGGGPPQRGQTLWLVWLELDARGRQTPLAWAGHSSHSSSA